VAGVAHLVGFPFTQPDLDGQTRYFFAARLKYSRWMFVQFTTDMREETLLRCLIACFCALGGVPWVVTTDNMKTVTYGRDDQHQPLWTPAFQKLAVEFGFHPDACAVRMPQQKGSVENLVKFVKGHFLAGRQFVDDADLAQSCQQWLHQVNALRPSDATEQLPVTLLAEERARCGALPPQAADYGFFGQSAADRGQRAGQNASGDCHWHEDGAIGLWGALCDGAAGGEWGAAGRDAGGTGGRAAPAAAVRPADPGRIWLPAA
jgi:hypothetical protein